MEYKSKNKYKVTFKDGTFIESGGSADSLKKSSIENEFGWAAFHIPKEIRGAGKTFSDVLKIEYGNYILIQPKE